MTINDTVQMTVYYVNEDERLRNIIHQLCRSNGWGFVAFRSRDHFLSCNTLGTGCLIVDVYGELSGEQLVKELSNRSILIPVILVASRATVSMAQCAMRAGAFAFVEKPCSESELSNAISLALKTESDKREPCAQ